MRIGDVLYFSPSCRFSELDFGKPEVVVRAFVDRVEGFFFIPARRLVEEGHAFAAGLVICAAVEFIAAVWERQEPGAWLANIGAFRADSALANQFWERFRHGLAHEGRVKSFGQFSFETAETVSREGDVLIVNPERLLNDVEQALGGADFTANRSKFVAENLRRYFAAEVQVAQR